MLLETPALCSIAGVHNAQAVITTTTTTTNATATTTAAAATVTDTID